MESLKNPGLPGDIPFDTVIYASSGVNYSAVPALAQYHLYDFPDPAYVTGRIDVSAFANLGAAVPWQDFTLEVSSGARTVAIPASALHRLLYPDVVFGAGKIVMQTLRLPSRRLAEAGVELSDLRSIAFVFDRRATGVLYVGDVQVSN